MQAKTLVRSLLYRLGILGAVHALRNRDVLTTLMFHRVLPADGPDFASAEREFTFSVEGFGRCLDFVRRHYRCVTLQQVHDALQGGRALPPNPVLITFDDGWRDTLVHAQQALQQRGMNGVLFLATEPLGSTHALWWQYVLVHVLADRAAMARLCAALGLDTPEPHDRDAGQRLTARVAALPDDERHRLLKIAAPASLGGEQGRQMLSRADLDAFAPGCIQLGAHGHSHAPLLHCADADAELRHSYQTIAPLCGAPVSMSFPHGSYDEGLAAMSRAAGFQLAFTSEPELTVLGARTNPWKLGRIHVPENEWTCHRGQIHFPLLATFLFFRRRA